MDGEVWMFVDNRTMTTNVGGDREINRICLTRKRDAGRGWEHCSIARCSTEAVAAYQSTHPLTEGATS